MIYGYRELRKCRNLSPEMANISKNVIKPYYPSSNLSYKEMCEFQAYHRGVTSYGTTNAGNVKKIHPFYRLGRRTLVIIIC